MPMLAVYPGWLVCLMILTLSSGCVQVYEMRPARAEETMWPLLVADLLPLEAALEAVSSITFLACGFAVSISCRLM